MLGSVALRRSVSLTASKRSASVLTILSASKFVIPQALLQQIRNKHNDALPSWRETKRQEFGVCQSRSTTRTLQISSCRTFVCPPSFASICHPRLQLRTAAQQQKSFSDSAVTTVGGIQLKLSPEVELALKEGRPVVALESTIISHGMPYPQNVETAREVEEIVRMHGAVPATICVLGGEIRVGVSDTELEQLGQLGLKVKKTSTRDLPLLLSSGGDGATTVSATMWVANLAGIGVFVTGGIGGVHRGASESGDISADLTELSRTPVTVICAGVKSILDIRRTLEYLETVGVSVISYGTKAFPAFFSPDSGYQAQAELHTPQQIAQLVKSRNDLQLPGGTVVGVPIPAQAAAEGAGVEVAIQSALKEAEEQQIEGQAVTPFLLQRIKEITGGTSLQSNIALVKNNAAVGAKIAVELATLQRQAPPTPSYSRGARSDRPEISEERADQQEISAEVQYWISKSSQKDDIEKRLAEQGWGASSWDQISGADFRPQAPISGKREAKVLVVGGCVEDVQGVSANAYVQATSNPGRVKSTYGGVGRNIAEGIARIGEDVRLVSVVGSDQAGMALIAHCSSLPHLDATGVRVVEGQTTARFLAICNQDGDLEGAIADMEVMKYLEAGQNGWSLGEVRMVVADGNPPIPSLLSLAAEAAQKGIPLFFEPTSVPKAMAAAKGGLLPHVTFTTPNVAEVKAMVQGLGQHKAEGLEVEQLISVLLDAGVGVVIVTDGPRGVYFGTLDGFTGQPAVLRFEPEEVASELIVSTTGAGDSFAAGFIAATVRGAPMDEAVALGLKAASLTLQSEKAISPLLHTLAAQDAS